MTDSNHKPRILVLGAGALQGAHYRHLRSLGLYTIAMDRNPAAPAGKDADLFCAADGGDPDQVTREGRRLAADAILPMTEFGIVPAAIASERLGLRHLDVTIAEAMHDKWLMRQAWERHEVLQPRFHLARSCAEATRAADDLGYPVMVKPRCLSAARGVQVVRERDSLAGYYEKTALLSDGVLIEEFIDGIETSVEGLVIGDQVIVLAYGDKSLQPHPVHRVTRSINYQGDLEAPQVRNLMTCAQKAIGAFGLRNSPFHLEVFVRGKDVLPIECGARGGGGFIWSYIVELVSGLDFVDATIRLLLGNPVHIPDQLANRGACFRFLFAPQGRLGGVAGIEEARRLPNVVDLSLLLPEGTMVRQTEHGGHRAGCLVTRGEDRRAAMETADRAEACVQWHTSPD